MSGDIVSAVVLAWNRKELTETTVLSLAGTLPPDREIIVVDNGSTDGTRDMLYGLARRGWIDALLCLKRNEGVAHGFNYGLRMVRGKYVFLTDNDYRFLPGWCEACQAVLDTCPDVGLVSPSDNRHVERQIKRDVNGLTYMEEPCNVVTCAMSTATAVRAVGLIPTVGTLYGDIDVLWCSKFLGTGKKVVSLETPLAMHLDWGIRSKERESNEKQRDKLQAGDLDPKLRWKFTL